MEMRNYNRYFLETNPEIVGENALAIRKRTPLVESGIVSIKFKKGIMDKLETEEEKINFVLEMINKMEHCLEVAVRNQKSET